MALCQLKKDLLRTTSCGFSLPTVSDIWLANFSDVSATSIKDGEDGCVEVTAVTMDNEAKFYHIEPAKDSTEFSDSLAVGDSGNKYRTHSLTFTVPGTYDACMAGVLEALSLGRYVAIIKTAEGNYLMLGRLSGLEADADGSNLAGGSNANGITVTLSANVTEVALPVASDVIEKVLN